MKYKCFWPNACFSLFLLLFALGTVAVGNDIYIIFMWLAALCMFLVFVGCVIFVFNEKSDILSSLTQRNVCLYADVAISLAGLAISCAFDPHLRNVWIFLFVLAVLNFLFASLWKNNNAIKENRKNNEEMGI